MLTGFTNNYYSFQGQIFLYRRDSAGLPKGGWFIGNCPKAELDLTVDRRKHKESTSGQRLNDKIATVNKGGRLKMTLEDIQTKNLIAALAGTSNSLSGSYASSTYDTMATAAVGDIVKLKQFNISSLVIKDSAGSPATLALDTDYSVVDAKHGLIKILSLGSYTQPFRAQYVYAATTAITGFTGSDDDEFYVYCALINTEPSTDQAIGVEIYRVILDPVAALALINDEQGSLEIEGEVLRDSTRADVAAYGGFFRVIYPDANL